MTVRAQRSAPLEPLERLLRDFETVIPRLPEQVIPRAARRRAAEQLRQLGWPQTRDEQWRYLNLRAFERVGSFIPAGLDALGALPTAATDLALPAPLPGFERLIYVDGVQVSAELTGSAVQTAAPARAAGAVAFQPRSLEPSWGAEQRLGLLCDMFAQDTAALRVNGEAAIELLFISSARAAGAAVYPRVQLELAPGSRLTLAERHLGDPGGPALVCSSATVELGRASQLTHYRLQQCGPETLFCDSLAARLQEEASYRVRQVAVGGASARTSARVRLAGTAASISWHAIGVGGADQVHDCVLKVEHAAPRTRTEEVFRGIAEERARVAFSGHIEIEPAACGAEARQSLRGLIEGQGEVDLRPRLEINTDEVSAQHGATTGRLDDDLLFYLLSRGIDASTARTLLKWAFLSDVLRQIEQPELRVEAERSAADRLQDVLAIGALYGAAS